MYLYMNISGFFQDRICSVSWIYRFMSFTKLEKFSTTISSNNFLPSFFLLFWNSKDIHLDPLCSLFLFIVFCLCCSDWIIHVDLFSSSPILPLPFLFCYWVHTVSYFGYCIFQLKNFDLFLLYIFYFLADTSLLIFVSRVFVTAHLSIFKIAALKFLSGNCNIYVISLLMSVDCLSQN